MLKLTTTVLLICLAISSIGQKQTITQSVYFDTDKALLKPASIATLKILTDSIKTLLVDSIQVSGNTDNRASNTYNKALSQKRTLQVHAYIKAAGLGQIPTKLNFLGEEKPLFTNNGELGMQKNRRTDITIYYHLPVIIDSVIKDPCEGDTAIFLKNGTRLVFNKCEYLDKKDCIEFSEIFNPDAALENGLTTVDENDDILISGGMMDFKINDKEGCPDNCLENEVRIQIPVPAEENNFFTSPPGLYDVQDDGTWVRQEQNLEIIEVDGIQYYEFSVFCAGQKNIDMPCGFQDYEFVKFKAPLGYQFIELTLISEAPFSVIKLYPEDEKRERILADKKLPCFFGSSAIEGLLLNKEGDTVKLNRQPLNELDKFIWFARCNAGSEEIERKVMGLFPYKKRLLYRKYIIKKEELVLIE